MSLTLTFITGQVRCKYSNGYPIHDILFDGNSNVFHIFHLFQYIRCQNVHAIRKPIYDFPVIGKKFWKR